MNELEFAWDENKAQVNMEKHGITFEEAATVFADEDAVLFDDPEHSIYENRFIILGISSRANLLIVCHCYRESDSIIRIISARNATGYESNQYAEFNKR